MVTMDIDADGTYYLKGEDGLPHELSQSDNRNVKTGITEACRTFKGSFRSSSMPTVKPLIKLLLRR